MAKVISKISHMSSDEILSKISFVRRVFFVFRLFYPIVILFGMANNMVNLVFGCVILFPIVILGYARWIMAIQSEIRLILLEQLDVDRYLEVIGGMIPSQNGKSSIFDLDRLQLDRALARISLGQFDQAESILQEINVQGFKGRQKSLKEVDYYYFSALLTYFKGDRVNFEVVDNALSSVNMLDAAQERLKATYQECLHSLKIMGSTDAPALFESLNSANRLYGCQHLYFQGLAHLALSQPQEAKDCFTSIVNENPDLFYVKEAKRYVEELS